MHIDRRIHRSRPGAIGRCMKRTALACAVVAASMQAAWVHAQSAAAATEYPARAVRIVAPQPPGSGVDTYVRAIAQKLTEGWGQPVLVDNRAGANGIIGVEQVIKSKPDGYTVLAAFTSVLVINPHVYKSLPYDVSRDLAPIMQTVTNTMAFVVHPNLPVRSVKELVALAKARPGQLSYASNGVGNVNHLAAELLAHEAGLKLLHVPYKGATPALQDLMGGQVAMSFNTLVGLSPHIHAGKLRLLATCGEKRASSYPDTPTMFEAGLTKVVVTGWGGFLAPAGTPPEVVARFQREAARTLQGPELRERLTALGSDPTPTTTEQFAAFITSETDKWAQAAKQAGIYRSQ